MTRMRLAWFTDCNPRRWDEPGAGFGYDWRDASFHMDMARTLERGLFDVMIFTDNSSIPRWRGSIDEQVEMGDTVGALSPLLVLTAMAAVTRSIGLAATMSTTVNHPFLVAREFATLDHLSAGRAAWNIVTAIDNGAAQNYGEDQLPGRDDRYDHADEFLEVCRKLWTSWDRDAIRKDRERGIFAEVGSIREINHEGRFFKVRGPLNTPPGPQVQPCIMQAGGSPRGMDFAAKNADFVLAHSNTLETMKTFCSGIKERAAKFGRDPADVKVFFTLKPFIGDTHADAANKRRRLYDYMGNKPTGEVILSIRTGLDITQYPLDEPLKESDIPDTGMVGFYRQHYSATGERPTLRQLAATEGVKESLPCYGTPDEIADQMEMIMEKTGNDGFAIRDSLSPLRVTEIVDLLVPVLRKRGLIRGAYRPGTLRENLMDETV